jgi:uncharacterized protein
MKIVDANVMLYAVNQDAPHHAASRAWLERALSGAAVVGFAWQPLLAFFRIATKQGIFSQPMSPLQAAGWIDEWLAQGAAREVRPGPRHTVIMAELLLDVGTAGNLVNDAHLAALAIEQRGEVVSFDGDFSRFRNLRWERPEV